MTKLGRVGPIRLRLTILLSLSFGVIPAIAAFLPLFIAPAHPTVTCTDRTNTTITTTTQDVTMCLPQTWVFTNPHTVTAEFDLIGDRDWMVQLLNSG